MEKKQRTLAGLVKMYNESNEYGGAADVLDNRLRIFKDLCQKAGVKPEWYADAFSTMLKDQASKHYYRTIADRGKSFNERVLEIRTHFETPQRRDQVIEQWERLNFSLVMAKNPGKSPLEQLELLREDILDMQEKLPADMQSEDTARLKLYRAVQGIGVCSLALMKKQDTFEGACEDNSTGAELGTEPL